MSTSAFSRTATHAVLLSLLAGPQPLFAAETSQPVIVTATRVEQANANAPANITVVTHDDIQRSPARTLPELLTLEAGVLSRSLYGNHAARGTVDLRGFGVTSGQNTLILLDGRRLNDVDLAAVDYTAIPLDNIERIEVIRGGGGSVLYGDGAVGGAINIVTKQPAKAGTQFSMEPSYGSYDTRQLDLSLSHTQGDIAVTAHASGIDSNGYRDNNDLSQRNIQADLRWLQARGEVFIKGGYDDQELDLPGVRTVDPTAGVDQLTGDREGTATPTDYANQDGYFITLGATRYLSPDIEVIFDLGYRSKDQQAFFDDLEFGGAFAQFVDTRLATFSVTPRVNIEHDIAGLPMSTTTGVDVYLSEYDSDRSLNPDTSNTPVHQLAIDQTSIAVYGQSTMDINKATSITLGVRLQDVDLEAQDSFDATAPGAGFESEAPDLDTAEREHMLNLGVQRQLTDDLSIYARLERSVRYWTVDEVFETDPQTFQRVFSSLEPQVSRGIDVGMTLSRQRLHFQSSLYFMKLRDEIHFNPQTFTNVNLDPTRRYGLEASLDMNITDTLDARLNYTHTRSEFVKGPFDGRDVPVVPRNTVSGSISWAMTPAVRLVTSGRHVGAKYFDNDQTNSFKKIPAYEMVDVKLSAELGKWQLTGTVNNLFAEEAFDYGVRSLSTYGRFNAYPLPERHYTVSVRREI